MSLFIVATPIGNLSDITLRAVETLSVVDLIVCEDTRHTLQLLNHLGIKKPLISYHQYSKIQKIEQIVDSLKNGKEIAMVSDAGTPSISDPGSSLIQGAIKANIKVIPIPGVSALTTLLSVSGLELSEWSFYGFLPNKKGRQSKIIKIVDSRKPSIIFESPYRIKKLLKELKEFGMTGK